jgi:hypothetical protein
VVDSSDLGKVAWLRSVAAPESTMFTYPDVSCVRFQEDLLVNIMLGKACEQLGGPW